MSNPDLRRYVDLRLLDVDAQDVFDRAVGDAQAKVPEWEPAEGQTEVVLAEALALQVSEAVFAINRLPDATAGALFRLLGVEVDPGEVPTATLRITIAGAGGVTLPAGTRVALPVEGLDEPLVFTTTQPLSYNVGGATVRTVPARGSEATSAANGTEEGTPGELLDRVLYVEAVTFDEVSGGRDPETDEAWRNRAVQRLARLTETLALPDHFTAAALERPDVGRAVTVDAYDPTAGPGGPGDHPGHVTVALLGIDAEPLDPAVRDEIRDELDAQALAHLIVHTVDPDLTVVDVDVTVVRTASADAADVEQDVRDAVEGLLDPLSWPFGALVRRNLLLSVIGGLPTVSYVDDLVAPSMDVELTGVAPLPVLGTLDVTVLGPEDVA